MSFDLDRYFNARTGERIGSAVRYVERTASTMDDARSGADRDVAASRGTAYVAGEQTAGRGRQGRSWVSAASVGLYVTFHLSPRLPADALERLPLVTVAGAMAAADAIAQVTGLSAEVKWPNDLLHDGRKLAGTLAEARFGPDGPDVFLGIGVNLVPNVKLPPGVAEIATSVQEAVGRAAPPREELLAAIADALEVRLAQVESDPGRLVEEWTARLVTIGREVRLATPAGDVEGRAVGVTALGELELELPDGRRHAYSAGDVHAIP